MQQTTTYKLKLIETSDLFSPDALNDNAQTLETQLARVDAEAARIDAALSAKAPQAELTTLTQTVAANKSAAETALAAKAEKTALTAEETARKSEIARVDADVSAVQTAAAKAQSTADAAQSTANTKAPTASPTLTGTPKAPTASAGTNTTQIATTAFVTTAVKAEESARKSEIARLETAASAEKTRVNGELAQRPRMVYGSYTGDGTYGKTNPKKLDFASTLGCAPKVLIIGDSGSIMYQLTAVNGAYSTYSYPSSDGRNYLIWTETGVEWYNSSTAARQMNDTHEYYYVALA